MIKLLTIVAILIFPGGSVVAQEADSTGTPVDIVDSTIAADTTLLVDVLTLVDSIKLVFPDVDIDTLTEAQRMLVDFETRYHLRKAEQAITEEIAPQFSYFDSLAEYFVSPRWDLRGDIDCSFYHDAGDYFKFDPGFFIVEHQVTPMRKTVQPYSLAGDRLGVLVNGTSLTPFEHNLEPDGLVDLEDVPSALDHRVAILPGPVGMVFGGRHSAATLLTRPKTPVTTSSESTFLVDKGPFGYSYARGRYSKLFTDGRTGDASIGYRTAEGPVYGREDDAYYYTGDFYFPFGSTTGMRAAGRLYDRRGPLYIRPDYGGTRVIRDRFDRLGQLSLVKYNNDHNVKYTFGYTHLRQASSINRGYTGRFNYTGNSVITSREWITDRTIVKAEVDGSYLKYDDWIRSYERSTGRVSLSLAHLTGDGYRWAVDLRQTYIKDFKFLPSASGMVTRESDGLFFMAAVGYSERAPSLHELHLRYQEASIYGSGSTDYADHGNEGLVSERQLIGSADIHLGTIDRNVGLSVTGGKILHGIIWQNNQQAGQTVFSPVNSDVNFASATLGTRYRLADILRIRAGGSYHYLDYELFEDKVYTPEYQAFSGAELHWYWSSKLIHLYVYGEVVYVGPYNGYEQLELGNVAVANGKLSFRMGNFRFHWVIQNIFSNLVSPREYFRVLGRFNYWGFTWDFLD